MRKPNERRRPVLLVVAATLLLFSLPATGQQDAQFTQFAFNKLAFNPGYAGATEYSTVSVLARSQWLGLEGAPSSQIATLNLPFSELGPGMGLRFDQVAIGLERQLTFEGSYAYGIPLPGGGRVGLGLSASARYLSVDYQNARPTQGGGVDPAIPGGSVSKIVPNFGAGVYVETARFYAGLGVPRLLENNIDLGDEATIISREARHFYFMSGLTFPLGSSVKVQPQALAKFVPNAPFDLEATVLVYIGEVVFTGGGYRLGGDGSGESASALFGATVGRRFTFSFAYDLGLSRFSTDQGGSVEALLSYRFGRSRGGRFTDPRDLQ